MTGASRPAPSVRWLREAYGALGVWTLGRGETALPESSLADALTARDAEMIQARIKLSAGGVGGSVERLENGILVIERLGDRLAALVLPTGGTTGGVAGDRLDRIRGDLQSLLEGRASAELAVRLFPSYPEPIPLRLPAAWLPMGVAQVS